MTDPIRIALDRLHEYALGHPNHDTDEIVAAVRAALAQSAPPAEGEVGELVKWLRENAEDERQMCESANQASLNLDRAADLMEQRHPAPVSVSERLPGPEDCALWPGEPDETPWCWVFTKGPVDDDSWERRPFTCVTSNRSMHSHWLPAHALPLPAGKMKP